MKKSLICITSELSRSLEIEGLTLLGGAKSRGISLEGLAHPGDYVALSYSGAQIDAHPLRGASKKSFQIQVGKPMFIDDLVLLIPPNTDTHHVDLESSEDNFLRTLTDHGQMLTQTSDLTLALDHYILSSVKLAQMQSGLLISKDHHGKLFVRHAVGLQPDTSWLSESLVKQCLVSLETQFIQNIVGSPFEKNRSLMAHSYLSFLLQPLVVRGEVLGVLFLCSPFTHPGLSENVMNQLKALTQMCAIAFHFQRREGLIQEELDRVRKTSDFDAAFQSEDSFLKEQMQIARQVAATDLAVIVRGETGVGKEKMARWIHDHSERKKGPFVAINCGAIPSELLESLLFGHRKGAFTGAHRDQVGKFEVASGGTLFLDEVGDLPPQLQVKLLRVLQEKRIDPVGSRHSIAVNVRILAATHRDLEELRRRGQFRDDLYYRLAEVSLKIPALRERPRDIVILAQHILSEIGVDKHLSIQALAWLEAQPWLGNIRELQSSLRRAALLSSAAVIQVEDFKKGAHHSAPPAGLSGQEGLRGAKDRATIAKLRQALAQSKGNRKQTAEKLGITTRTLFRYLDQYKEELTEVTSASDRSVT